MKLEEETKKDKSNHDALKKILSAGESVVKKHNNNSDNIESRNHEDLTTLLRMYRRKGEKIPMKKNDLVDVFHKWKTRNVTTFNGRKDVVDLTADNDAVHAAAPDVKSGVTLPPVAPPVEANGVEVWVNAQELQELDGHEVQL